MPYSEFGNTVYYYGDPALEGITDLKSFNGREQVYADIFNEAVNSGTHFKDHEFPHDDNSVGDMDKLFDTADAKMLEAVTTWKADGWNGRGTWIRVADLCTTIYKQSNVPCFNCGDIGKTIARNDIHQGCTGDCWFLSSVSDISMVPSLIKNVVPADNSTNDQGVYHFRFWYQGAWVDIVVDDYLPCVVTKTETFTIGTNFYPNNGKAEFWPMMLEKAYAKLNGSYSAISANWIVNAQENLTGGFGEFIEVNDHVPADTYEAILKWFDRGCLVGAGTSTGGDGIVGGHAYSVTGAHIITTNDGTRHKLLRCRNPWGRHEFKGHWSDDSSKWNEVSEEQKKEIKFHIVDDGEFWIDYHDFLKYYSNIDACYYYDSNSVNQSGSQYQFAQFNTSWSVASKTAGGFDSPWQNPLFEVQIASSNATGLLAVGLQVQTKLNSRWNAGDCIRLFPAGTSTTFDQKFFQNAYSSEIFPAGKTKVPGNSMFSYNQFYFLAPGKYIIVPSSLNAGLQNKLLVRVYNEGHEEATQVSGSGSGSSSGSASGNESN